MNSIISKRIIDEANYIIKTQETLRQVANIFNVSKSTVHKDMQDRLIYLNSDLFHKVDKVLEYHKEIRHIRGGESTRKKYIK